MNDKDFKSECQRLERLGYEIITKDNRINTATAKKGRRLIQIGETK